MAFLFEEKTQTSAELRNDVDPQELLVFGYHCKLFRDDEKARAIDEGEHLIPWMGDTKLLIDRYDGRGHLFDLKPYDADLNHSSDQLTAEEARIEALCEEERYLELHTDLTEKAIQEEEELKRLNQELAESSGYQAVGFSYDEEQNNTETFTEVSAQTEEDTEEDHVFVPPPELCLPKSMVHPQGTKENKLIEKTAKYVSEHGGQMEIMIKTKQSNNPQFAFLHFEHPLNPYYKHQVYMIKTGRYNPDIHNKTVNAADEKDDEDSDDEVGYLHPSLLAKSTNSSQQGTGVKPVMQLSQSQLADTSYGRLMKKLVDQQFLSNSPHRSLTPSQSDSNLANYSDYQQYAAYYGYGDGFTASYEGFYDYQQQLDPSSYSYYEQYQRPASPPEEVKPFIEKLLVYVKKDGEGFEKQVMLKNDDRFSFLNPDNEHHLYYLWKKQEVLNDSLASAKNKAVSFSIKQKELEPSTMDSTKKAALPVDPESDEDSSNKKLAATNHASYKNQEPLTAPQNQPDVPQQAIKVQSTVESKTSTSLNDEAIQRKLAEQKLKDKLAAAMREKMTQVTSNTREKSLQAERKKKAAMFVELIKAKKQNKETNLSSSKSKDLSDIYGVDTLDSAVQQSDERSRSSAMRHNEKSDRSRRSPHSHRHKDSDSRRRDRDRDRDNDRHRDKRHSKDRRRDRSREKRSRSRSPSRSKRRSSRSPSISKSIQKLSSASSLASLVASKQNRVTEPEEPRSGTLTPNNSVSEKVQIPMSKEEQEYIAKVRSMLKVSRREVYKEDLFGNDSIS